MDKHSEEHHDDPAIVNQDVIENRRTEDTEATKDDSGNFNADIFSTLGGITKNPFNFSSRRKRKNQAKVWDFMTAISEITAKCNKCEQLVCHPSGLGVNGYYKLIF